MRWEELSGLERIEATLGENASRSYNLAHKTKIVIIAAMIGAVAHLNYFSQI